MTVIVEFSLPAKSFPFGQSTSGDPNVRVQLERLVPLGQERIPFVWATGERFDQSRHTSETATSSNTSRR